MDIYRRMVFLGSEGLSVDTAETGSLLEVTATLMRLSLSGSPGFALPALILDSVTDRIRQKGGRWHPSQVFLAWGQQWKLVSNGQRSGLLTCLEGC